MLSTLGPASRIRRRRRRTSRADAACTRCRWPGLRSALLSAVRGRRASRSSAVSFTPSWTLHGWGFPSLVKAERDHRSPWPTLFLYGALMRSETAGLSEGLHILALREGARLEPGTSQVHYSPANNLMSSSTPMDPFANISLAPDPAERSQSRQIRQAKVVSHPPGDSMPGAAGLCCLDPIPFR